MGPLYALTRRRWCAKVQGVDCDGKGDETEHLRREIAMLAESLALQNALDLKLLARANVRRLRTNDKSFDGWSRLKAYLKVFLTQARSHDYPVRFLRNQLPTKVISSSQDIQFLTLARDLLRTLSSENGWTAYWFHKRLVTYKVFIDIPFTTLDESLVAVRRSLLSLSRNTTQQHRPNELEKGSQQEQPPTNNKEQSAVGATFDLYGPESLRRVIFQYWVYDTETDEIAAEGSLIAKGDTLQEATRHLFDSLRGRLGATPNPNLKVHIKKVDEFVKQPPSGTKSLAEQFVDAVRDEIKRAGGTP